MERDVPADANFESAFAEASVGKAAGRYLLNCLNESLENKPLPHLGIDDPTVGDLEHIMPENPDEANWPHLEKEDHERLKDRLGNHTLLTKQENQQRGNSSFDDAKKVYKNSGFAITQLIAKHSGKWDDAAIQARQEHMASLALTIWPVKPAVATKTKKKKSP